MHVRRMVLVGMLLGALIVPATADAAGALHRNVSGTMTGPGGFRSEGCGGIISVVGSGTYTSKGLGQGTYTFDVCVVSTSPFTFSGPVTFTRGSGAVLNGTVVGTMGSAQQPNFLVSVTGGTKRYVKARGDLTIGPLVETDSRNCNPRVGICLDWTDTGPVTGTLRHVRRHD